MKKTKSGISLIVLVITILVLSILAATVIISVSNTNVIEEANKTVFKSDLSNYREVFEMYVTTETMKNNSFDSSSLDGTYKDNEDTFNKIFGKVESKYQEGLAIQDGKLVYETEDETEKAIADSLGMGAKVLEYISKDTTDGTSPYIGYFADVDGDGTVDGVIFADLAYSASGEWYNSDGAFSYTAVVTGELKDYEISQENYTVEGATGFGTKPVLKAKGSGKDRFYVMALSDFTTSDYSEFYWYVALINSTIKTKTSTEFGSGKQNTVTMISEWNTSTTNSKHARDMWGVIQQEVYGANYSYTVGEKQKTVDDVEWFVPSSAEWAAFAYYLATKRDNPLREDSKTLYYGLNNFSWTSSAYGNADWICVADLYKRDPDDVNEGSIGLWSCGQFSRIRLAATF